MKILYLYRDLMNLYGEYANIWILERSLREQGLDVEVDHRTLGDKIDFSSCDFVYCGAGTERSQKAALQHLSNFRSGLKEAADRGTVALFTGNACDMMGKSIQGTDGREYRGLEILDFQVKEVPDKRFTGDAIASFGEIQQPLVGFVNKCSEIKGVSHPLFEMKMGMGNMQGDSGEGWRKGNFFGTHLIGPVLVKNPAFLSWLVQKIGLACQQGFTVRPVCHEYEEKAYQTTYEALEQRRTGR